MGIQKSDQPDSPNYILVFPIYFGIWMSDKGTQPRCFTLVSSIKSFKIMVVPLEDKGWCWQWKKGTPGILKHYEDMQNFYISQNTRVWRITLIKIINKVVCQYLYDLLPAMLVMWSSGVDTEHKTVDA